MLGNEPRIGPDARLYLTGCPLRGGIAVERLDHIPWIGAAVERIEADVVARIVDMYARRLQIQENLSRQIADAVQQVTGALGVAVVIEAKHMCMMMRGVEKQNSSMITSVMLGEFRENAATRSEFLSLIK